MAIVGLLLGLRHAVLSGTVLAFLNGCATAPQEVERHVLLEECGPEDALCATVRVFEDRERASGRTIDLKVVVYPARSRDAEPDPVFFLAGGPGQAAAETSSLVVAMLDRVRQDRDVVFVDQRGTGESNGLPCDQESDDLQLLGSTDHALKTIRECLEGYDADLRFYTTPVAMDDLDEVREQLGYSMINLWGVSYGTRAALVYLRRHGEHVRSAVLDAVAPLGMKLPASFALDAQRALDLTFDACEAEDRCRKRFPDLRVKFGDLLDRLERQSVIAQVRHPRTGEDERVKLSRDVVTGVLRAALYSSATASLVPLFIDQMHGGDFNGVLALAVGGVLPAEAKNYWGMFYSVICAEDIPWIDDQELRRDATGTFLSDSTADLFGGVCSGREWGVVAEDYHEPVRSEVPTLVLSGKLDPVTPPRWGDMVVEYLSNARHIVAPGLGHGTGAMGCVPDLIETFLGDADASAIDAACVQELKRPPFFVTHGGPAMTGAQ